MPQSENAKERSELYYFNYIKKCVKSEYSYSNISYVKNFVYDYIHTDEDFKKIKRIFWNSRCWSEFKSKLENAFDSEGYE